MCKIQRNSIFGGMKKRKSFKELDKVVGKKTSGTETSYRAINPFHDTGLFLYPLKT